MRRAVVIYERLIRRFTAQTTDYQVLLSTFAGAHSTCTTALTCGGTEAAVEMAVVLLALTMGFWLTIFCRGPVHRDGFQERGLERHPHAAAAGRFGVLQGRARCGGHPQAAHGPYHPVRQITFKV